MSKDKPPAEVSIIVALMEQVEGLRSDLKRESEMTRDDIARHRENTDREFKEVRADLAEVKERLAAGSERMKNMQSDIDSGRAKCVAHATTALVPKQQHEPTTERSERKPRMAWWVPLLIGGALAWVGERGVQVAINALATPPPAVIPQPSPLPAKAGP